MCTSTIARLLLGALGLVLLSELGAEEKGPALPAPASKTVDFKQDVYPILQARCFGCHQGTGAKAGYRLDLKAEVLGETNGKPLVKVGESGKSRLIQLVAGAVPDKVMPPRGERLTAEQVGLLRAWIDQELKWDDTLLPPLDRSKHWAFQPVQRPPVPKVKNTGWIRTPVDAFIAERHEARGLTPAPEADRRTLVRRLYLDLLGLPPSIDDIERALSDKSDNWYDELVERLLQSPHYGERWCRHWLDLARWAESEGYESNHPRPYAWRYRDWVVRSFNDDKPFTLFVRQQLAGDEIEPYSDENLIATGYLAAARLSSNEEDKPRQRNDILVDIVNATGNALLGLTIHCAQCHNHKFDAISARDYYRLQGFFIKGQPGNLVLKNAELWQAYHSARPAEHEPAQKLQQALFENARKFLIAEARKKLSKEQVQALETPAEQRSPEMEKLAREADLKFQFTPQQIEKAVRGEDRTLYAELKKKLEALEKKMPDKPQTWGFYSATSPHRVEVLPMKGFYPLAFVASELARAKPHLLISGEVHNRSMEVDVGWPRIFGPAPGDAGLERKPRLALANWLTSPDNPLTARVWVNRLWHYHFGRGIVASVSDFGVKGAPPTHPELLDWLAHEFMQTGWKTKHLHRLMVRSATYRQSSVHHLENGKLDPDNQHWWRWQPRRLEAEAIRDSILAVSGELERAVGGPSVTTEEATPLRRGLYLFQKRDAPPPLQALFDGPSAAAESCPKRFVSTVPLQSLYLLNNAFVLERSKAFAKRALAQVGDDRGRQIDWAFRQALGRAPDDKEREASRNFLAEASANERREPGNAAPPPAALVLFCQALLNLNEFVYLE